MLVCWFVCLLMHLVGVNVCSWQWLLFVLVAICVDCYLCWLLLVLIVIGAGSYWCWLLLVLTVSYKLVDWLMLISNPFCNVIGWCECWLLSCLIGLDCIVDELVFMLVSFGIGLLVFVRSWLVLINVNKMLIHQLTLICIIFLLAWLHKLMLKGSSESWAIRLQGDAVKLQVVIRVDLFCWKDLR